MVVLDEDCIVGGEFPPTDERERMEWRTREATEGRWCCGVGLGCSSGQMNREMLKETGWDAE